MKPDMSSILGISAKKKPSEAPPDDPGMEPGPLATDPSAGGAGEEAGESDLQPSMMSYHGGDQSCGSCSHFQAPTTCDRWPDSVEEAGWCSGWQAGSLAPDVGGSGIGGMPVNSGVGGIQG